MPSWPKILNLQPLARALGLTKADHYNPGMNQFLDEGRKWQPPEDVYRIRGQAIQLPYYPMNLLNIRDMAKYCHIFRLCIMKIGQETFRRGLEWVALEEGLELNEAEYHEANEWFKKIQMLPSLRRFEDDLNTWDVGFLVLRFDYIQNKEGEIILRVPIDMVRGSPIFMRQVSDERGNLGGMWRICLVHRHDLQGPTELRCPKCGKKTYDVHFICLSSWSGTDPLEYYVEGEVIKRTKFEPARIYGQSLIATNWRKGYTLMYMDKFTMDRFELGRQVDTILSFPSTQQEELEKTRQGVDKMRKMNPHYVPWIGYDPESKNLPAFVSVNREFEETQLIPLVDKYEQQIAAQYGIPPIMRGDLSGGGGLNNEGNQLVIPNRTVTFGQQTYNGGPTMKGVLEELTDLFEIRTCKLQLKPPEEEDEMAERQREAQEIQNAKAMLDMGASVSYENGEFVVKDTPLLRASAPNIFGQSSSLRPEGVGEANQTSGHPGTPIGKSSQKKKSSEDLEGRSLTKEFWAEATKAIVDGALWGKYADLSELQSKSVNQILAESILKGEGDLVLKSLTDKLMNIGLDYAKAELIGRTEMTAVANKAREIGYERRDPSGLFQYKWSVHHDHRTSPTCKRIDEMVKAEGGAVSLKRMREIHRSAVEETMPKDWAMRDWTPHPNCRSTLQRTLSPAFGDIGGGA